MFLSILLLFIFIKRSFFSNFLHILCPFIVYFASFVDSIGNIHASRNLFYHLWKLTTLCKMNEFLRRHFYVPFWEFVHLHMQYCSFANSILKTRHFHSLHLPGNQRSIFICLLSALAFEKSVTFPRVHSNVHKSRLFSAVLHVFHSLRSHYRQQQESDLPRGS